jgi:hypothetical protein
MLLFYFLRRIIKNVDVQPPERLKMMVDMMKTIETKEHGPCGNFTMMYGCMCDYFSLQYMEEVPWVGIIIIRYS